MKPASCHGMKATAKCQVNVDVVLDQLAFELACAWWLARKRGCRSFLQVMLHQATATCASSPGAYMVEFLCS